MSYFAMLPRFHVLKIGRRIEIFDYSTVQAFLHGGTKHGHLLFLELEKTKAGTQHFTGVIVAARLDAGLDKVLEMRAECNGCSFHGQLTFMQNYQYFIIMQII